VLIEFKIFGSMIRVQGSEFRVQGSGFRVPAWVDNIFLGNEMILC